MAQISFEAVCERPLKYCKNVLYIGTKINLRQSKALGLKLITKTGKFTLFLMIYLIFKSLKLL